MNSLKFESIVLGVGLVIVISLILIALHLEGKQRGKECIHLMQLATSWSDSTLVYTARNDCLWRIQ